MKVKAGVVALTVALVATTAYWSTRVAFAQTILTGSITLTASKGECASDFQCFQCPEDGMQEETLDLDSLTVHVDVAGSRNAAMFKTGCTGTVRKLTIDTIAQDAVRVGGAHDMVIGGPGSSISCTTNPLQGHQDGIQVTSGSNITFRGIFVGCASATNGQIFIDAISSSVPTGVLAVHSTFAPDPSHVNNVIIGVSENSGVRDSIICPDGRPNPVQISPNAVNPVNIRNQFPTSC